MRNASFALLLCASTLLCSATQAQQSVLQPQQAAPNSPFSIAATVNEDAITHYDVQNRIRFIMATTGVNNTPESAKKLYPRVVRTLVDEKLQLQEAMSNNIAVSSREIAEAINNLEQERGKEAGSLKSYLEENGVDSETFEDQIRAQIAWSKLLQKSIIPKLRISDAELLREVEYDTQQKKRVPEVKLASLVLPVTQPSDELSIQLLANQMSDELRKGVSFQALSQQLSDTQAAITTPTWVPTRKLDPKISDAIKDLAAGNVTLPVRTAAGYQVISVLERRVSDYASDAEVLFKEIILNLDADATKMEVDVLMGIARNIRKNPGACGTKNIASATDLEALDFEVDYTRTRLSGMSSKIVPLVRSLKVGDISEPFATPEGIRLLKLCERTEIGAKAPDTQPYERKVKEEKFKMEAIKYLRDLRRDAFIDIKS